MCIILFVMVRLLPAPAVLTTHTEFGWSLPHRLPCRARCRSRRRLRRLQRLQRLREAGATGAGRGPAGATRTRHPDFISRLASLLDSPTASPRLTPEEPHA